MSSVARKLKRQQLKNQAAKITKGRKGNTNKVFKQLWKGYQVAAGKRPDEFIEVKEKEEQVERLLNEAKEQRKKAAE